MARVVKRNHNNGVKFVADRDYKVGELVEKYGKVGVTCGEDAIATGEMIYVDFDAIVEIEKTVATLVIADGATVGYTTATQTAVAATTGDFDVGVAFGASASGTKTVKVLLNF